MKTQIFAPFDLSKTEVQDDGTIKVFGIASTESVDADGEIIKATAIEAALPDFMKYGGTGALREMHQLVAAGTVKAEVIDGVTHVEAHVVDAGTVKKVQAGVLKGFSVGGKVTSRDPDMKKTITGVKLVEISLVDRPNCPDAVVTCYKVEGDAEEEGEETPPVTSLNKSLWQVGTLADILSGLKCLQSDVAWEAAYEGDNSPIPARLKAAVTELAAILMDMVTEEHAEAAADTVAAAEVAEPIAKVEPAAELESIALAKVDDMISAALAKALAPITEENALLKAEVDRLAALPAAPKGMLVAVPKTEPVNKADEIEPVRKADGSIDEFATEIKKVHAAGPVRA